jgi:hypothetical protein
MESIIQRNIIKKLEADGWFVVKHIQTNRNGFPDLQALKDGKCIFIEVKRPGGRTSDLQKHRLKQLTDKGFDCYIINDLKQLNDITTNICPKLPEIRPIDYPD